MRVRGDLESDLETPSITLKKSARPSRVVSKSPRQITIIKERKNSIIRQPTKTVYIYMVNTHIFYSERFN